MGGNLWVESNYGRGSQFYFTMNVNRFELPKKEVMTKMQRFTGRRVLFLDSMNDQTGVMDRIQEIGLQTYRVTTIAEATDLANANTSRTQPAPFFDMVILDKMRYANKVREIVPLRYTPIVLIAPEIHLLNMKLCIDLGITGYINSPINLADLSDAILPALESHAALPSDASKTVPLEILLAEDNVVNQKLAVRILEKFGHHVKIVGNGKLAVEAFESQPFDMILMDVQMPIMGGFEATQKIREIEQSSDMGRIPIIALTAHAMIGDRDRCMQAGMVS
jgi:CheY-like chemotaxis protein